MIFTLAVITAVTFGLSILLPVVVKPLLAKLGIIDVPNERSSHTRPIIRGLGLATLFAMLGGYLVTLTAGNPALLAMLWVVAGSALAAGAIGLAEDMRGLRVLVRSALQLTLAALAVNGFVSIQGAAWIWIPYGILFVSSYINVANFMDGINGISGMHGAIAGVTFATAGLVAGQLWLVVSGLILAAAFAGFLPWNLLGSGAFLGDVGSYLLGGAVAATSIGAAIAGVPWLATIGPMILYFGDVAATLIRRVRRGEKWYEPHREHVYEQLTDLGYSHARVTSLISTLTIIASFLGLASFWVTGIAWWMLLAGGLALTGFYLLLPRILPPRHARVA